MRGDVTPGMARATVKKIAWRILPLAIVLNVVAFLDRVNLGYAALQMNRTLGLSSEAFGFAAGVFFVGGLLFEVPSNILLLRFGPRKWISRIIVTWGVIATLTAFVQSPMQLYVLRFLLGVAEAGFLPGMVFYLSFWFREKERASALGLFLFSMPLTYVIAAPISTTIMQHAHWLGIEGWRWMLFIEGLPALIGGVVCFFMLAESPEQARWLSASEKAWLADQFEQEQKRIPHARDVNARQALTHPTILLMALIFFLSQIGALGIGYWLPQIVRTLSSTLSLTQVGLVSGLPYVVTSIALIVWARWSDRFRERKLFAAIPLAIGAIGLFVAGTTQNAYVAILAITCALAGLFATRPPFFAILPQVVTRSAVAVSSAVIASIGNVGGFAGPYIVGVVTKVTHWHAAGLLTLSAVLLLASVLTLFINVRASDEMIASRSLRDAGDVSGTRL